MHVSRRHMIATAAACAAVPQTLLAKTAKVIGWDDLIPPGVPYAEIIAEGEMDYHKDIWLPVFDDNATKLNPALDGAYIRMPGFILPIDANRKGVRSFVLVPYVGACLHTPPPPANQLVFVTTKKRWPSNDLWSPVWVTGRMKHELQTTDVAETGYVLKADAMEVYEW